MCRAWDYDVPKVEIWREVLRVLKPGGHLLSFAGTRTQHRMAVNIEDAGFDIRDMLAWVYGSGFPKSHDISKAIDRESGADREVVGLSIRLGDKKPCGQGWGQFGECKEAPTITAPATPEAQQWEGWGSALKPALEPITLARKPLQGTLAQNVQEHGTGGLNIDGCRVEAPEGVPLFVNGIERDRNRSSYDTGGCNRTGERSTAGRWPANLIHSGEPEVVACFPESSGGAFPQKIRGASPIAFRGDEQRDSRVEMSDSGSAARFFKTCPDDDPEDAETRRLFYQGKATKRDRDEWLEGQRNNHCTVKPTPLMQYLCRLITPPGGIILDPFTGSGSTGKAAVLEGFQFIGIEMEPEYVAIANARIAAAAARSEKASLEQRVAWLETQVQAQGAKLRKIEATQQLSLWESAS
jgi:site-specific DNA-methyltransferase (adenine-specific)